MTRVRLDTTRIGTTARYTRVAIAMIATIESRSNV
jgi:hypothetical protein